MSDRYTFDHAQLHDLVHGAIEQIGRASCRERV